VKRLLQRRKRSMRSRRLRTLKRVILVMCVLVLIVGFNTLDVDASQGKFGYFVKWKGYNSDDNSWVHEDDAGYVVSPCIWWF